MCFGICAFIRNVIKTCIFIAIDVIVFFICSISDYIESLKWPVVDTFYGIFRVIVKAMFEVDTAYTPVPLFQGRHDLNVLTRGNDFIEDLLRDINDKLLEKSFMLEDKVAGVQNTKIVPVTGELKVCSNVRMEYRLMRAGNCYLREDGRRSKVGANIKGCELYFESDIQMEVGYFTKTFHVTGNIPYMEAYLEFCFNNETLEEGHLTEFIIIEMFGMNLKFVGAGPLNGIVNLAGKKLLKVFKRRIITILQEILRSQLAILIRTLKFPASGGSRILEYSPRSERLQAISEESDYSSPSDPQPASSESSDRSPPRDQQPASSESSDCSPPRDQEAAIPESVDRSSPSEQQAAIPESVDRASSSEQQAAISEAVDRPLPAEQQGQGLDGENSSSYTEQQMKDTAVDGLNFTDQNSSPKPPSPIPLINIEDYSQSSDNDTVETECSLET